MSLLWKNAAQLSRTAGWQPWEGTDEIHPNDLEGGYYPHSGAGDGGLSHHDVWGGQASENVRSLANSIRQHGYSPERHGQVNLNVTDHGENLYNTGPGSHPTDPAYHDVHHEHLLQALKDSGHGPVPVHIHDQRSDEDGTSAPRYYHGTTAEDLEHVHPNHGSNGNFGRFTHEAGYAYATGKENAWHYAERAAGAYGGTPHVYEVSPRGPVEEDPRYDQHGNSRGNFADDVRSKHGFTVVGEEPSRHEAHDEDDEEHWG
ncbi:NAD(+)--rifampin ADP-ribosyltransferase [Kitasatospora viridis]|uniref:Rifampin ADP-ribosyltransferase n=1 Tax=Kitasatospora viridis TaxID=281105 RepID=A0A561S9V1_9ACTN|nr:NAD(+)--rifampin ADP-ribosyltransferase [Kitasatospora viridis]TWF71652.1 rifampin ADP-ribosyltransferase [Kitasatospora viridis]